MVRNKCAPHQMLTFPSVPVAACKYTCMRTNLTCARANSMLVLFQLCVCCNQSVAPRARDQSRAGGAARRTLSAQVDAKQLAVQSDANSLLTRLRSPYFSHASSPPSRNQPCCHYRHAVAAGCPTPVFALLGTWDSIKKREVLIFFSWCRRLFGEANVLRADRRVSKVENVATFIPVIGL